MAQVGDSFSFINPNRVSPYNQQWQFSVQQQLPSSVVVEAAYVGMLSVKELETYNLNELPDIYLPLGTAQNTSVRNPFLGAFPVHLAARPKRHASRSGSCGSCTRSSRQPDHQWREHRDVAPTTRSRLRVEKRLSHGLTVTGTYSFSKLMHNNMTSIVNERRLPLDRVARPAAAFPGRVHLRSAGQVCRARHSECPPAGGRRMGGDGLPLALNRDCRSASRQANGRPIVIADPRIDGAINQHLGDRKDAQGNIINPYFNTHAFQALPTQYMVSPQVPYISQLRAPGQASLNASAFKNFAHVRAACGWNCGWRPSTPPIIRTSARPARTCRMPRRSA